jgi:hypothetical protein
MSAGIVASVLVTGAFAVYVFSPLFRGEIPLARRVADNTAEARDLQSKYDMLMSSLRDLEDDRATEKIGEEDYADLHARSTTQVIEVMRKLDALNAERRASDRPIPHPSSTPSGKSA